MKSFVLLRSKADRSYFKVIFNAKTRNVPNCIHYNVFAGWQSLLPKSFQPRMGNQIPMKPECTQSANHSELPLIYACLYTSSLSYARCHCELRCGAWCNPSAGKRWLGKTGDKEPGPPRPHSPEPFPQANRLRKNYPQEKWLHMKYCTNDIREHAAVSS